VALRHSQIRRLAFGLLGGRQTAPVQRRSLSVDWLEPRQLLSLSPTGVPLKPVAVEGTSFTSQVARFTDTDKNTDPTQYTVQIDWGDGHVTSGTVAFSSVNATASTFTVSGSNRYSQAGPYTAKIQISDKDGDSATVKVTNIVTDAALTATGTTLNASLNRAFTNVVVASFTDANPSAVPSNFRATIDWGDGVSSVGTVVASPTGGRSFAVEGSHVYRKTGAFTVQVQIRDGGNAAVTQFYTPLNLVSDGFVPADHTDPNLVNPWGLTASGGGPWWLSNNGTASSTLYDGAGNVNALVVKIPGPTGSPANFPATVTGIVTGGSSTEFLVAPGKPASFIFDTEDGTISGWNPTGPAGRNAASLKVDNSQQVYANGGVGAVYKGLALASNGSSDFLFAANFRSGNVDVFDSNFKPVTTGTGAFPGTFQDPSLPAGFAPFGIQNINGNLYVTYAMQDSAKRNDVDGAGLGFVDEYSSAGKLLLQFGGTATQPELNAPWGLALAPAGFGKYSNDLLVGNFGDSKVSAFDPATGNYLGQLSDDQGKPLVLLGGFTGPGTKGLWALRFGNGSGSGPATTLYFTSGVDNQVHGLLGSVTATSFNTASASSGAAVALTTSHISSGPTGGVPVLIPIQRMGSAENFFTGSRFG
jgi:uncharacterized protein (TIGR03118 family)